jgi:long-chain acyl-CoA synthetase
MSLNSGGWASERDQLHTLTIGDVLREHRRSRPHHLAAVDGTFRETYSELDHRVNRLCGGLRAAGLGAGDRLLWLGQNSFRMLECLFAAAKLGAILIPANWRQTADELAFVLTDSEPRVVVWQAAEVGDTVAAVRNRADGPAMWIQHDGTGDGSYEAFLAAGEDVDDEAFVPGTWPVLGVYTAAFEGRPSATLLSHDALVLENLAIARVGELDDTTVFLNSGPLFHLGTLMTTAATFQVGGTNVFAPRVDAEALCRLIEGERCNRAFLFGPTLEAIRALNCDRRFDLGSLWGDAPPEGYWPCTPSRNPASGRSSGYGQSEVVGLGTFAGLGRAGEGAHGRPLPVVQLRVVDSEGRELPPGEVGELVFRGPTVHTGYLHRAALNQERSTGGWHHTRDLGRREPDGSITFIGPMTRIIKSAFENIYPAEVESCIAGHPAVAEAAVIGIPDPRWTQSVKALVVLKPGAAASVEEIVQHCRAHIASYKKPRLVEFVPALPRRRDGSVDSEELDRLHGGGGYPGVAAQDNVPARPGGEAR